MPKYDEIWIANRMRYRKTLKGTGHVLDEETGYLQPLERRGFNAEMRKTFIQRFMICSNAWQVAKSVNIDIQAVNDAIAVDPKFRRNYIIAYNMPNRSKQLNDEMVKAATSEKTQLIADLSRLAADYE